MKLKKNIKIAIDSPAAAGAGTQAKLISKHYNLFYLDTGKIYRALAYDKLKRFAKDDSDVSDLLSNYSEQYEGGKKKKWF